MYVLIIVFMVLSLLIGLLSSFLVVREAVMEAKEQKKDKSLSKISLNDESKTMIKPHEEDSVDEQKEGTVAFSAKTQTLDEKYLSLNAESKGFYDEIVRYAMAIEESKRFKNSIYEEYKIGKNRLVRIRIKRGVIVCELVIYNRTFKNYIDENKVAIKQAPTIIKVVDDATLEAVKNSISIAVKIIEEEKAYKKEQAKLRRKQSKEIITK